MFERQIMANYETGAIFKTPEELAAEIEREKRRQAIAEVLEAEREERRQAEEEKKADREASGKPITLTMAEVKRLNEHNGTYGEHRRYHFDENGKIHGI